MIRKIILIVLCCYAGLHIVDRLFLLSMLDKSLEPSYFFQHIEQDKEKPTPVYLVSYAGGKSVFFKNQNAQALSAINQGIDHILMYKKHHIDADFYAKNKRIFDVPDGDGLWLWKPYFILKTMQMVPENSIIIYADSPIIFKHPVDAFTKHLKEHDIIVLRDGAQRKNNVVKAGARIGQKYIEQFGLPFQDFIQKDSLWACFVMVRNTKKARSFIEQWLKNCEDGIIGTPSYDQSMLVMASYQRPEGIYVMDTDEAMEVIKNVHRHPHEEHLSLLPDMASSHFKWFKISQWAYNAPWLLKLRAWF